MKPTERPLPREPQRSRMCPSSSAFVEKPSVAFSTLGCKLNQYETDSLATCFRDSGYRIVRPDERPDIHVINTCTVTSRADRKSRNLLCRAKRSAPRLIVLTGCFVDSRQEIELENNIYRVSNRDKHTIVDLVEAHLAGEVFKPSGSVFDFPAPDRVFHTRSMVKIQDGCDNHCSFCIIPHVRGRAQSRPWRDVVSEVKHVLAGGSHEIVFTGVNMSRYSDGNVGFCELIRRLLDLDGEYRVRISSLEPDRLTGGLVSLFEHSRMCNHLHLCLQSASDRVLLAMKRQYTFAEFRDLAQRFRQVDPHFNLTTDLIVGFPGETDEDFEESLRAVESIGFGHVHTFPYSVRTGTPAARRNDRLAEHLVTERARAIRGAAERQKRRYRETLLGSQERVLVERFERDGETATLHGLGEHYVPIEVRMTNPEADLTENRFVDVRLESLSDSPDPSFAGVRV
jgi:threonylcarbamoyladenosine tRNA methylthiotransferase MtaB